MRRLLVLTLLAGCGATPPPAAPPPPVVAPAQAIVSLALPGGPAATWPTAAPFAGGRYLLPYRDDHGLHVRLIGDAGDVDVDLGAGELLGAAARGDGFVVASALGATIEIHFLDGELRLQVELSMAGVPQPAIACDGDAVLVVTTERQGGATSDGVTLGHAALVRPAGVTFVELGPLDLRPSLYGDADGFIAANLLITSDGTVSHAPGAAVENARVFHRATAAGDSVTFDGDRWLELAASPSWAARDAGGADLVLPDGMLHVGADLTSSGAAVAAPAGSWFKALRQGRALVESLDGSDHVLAILDRATLAPTDRASVRVEHPQSRAVLATLGDSDALLAWVDQGGVVRYARW